MWFLLHKTFQWLSSTLRINQLLNMVYNAFVIWFGLFLFLQFHPSLPLPQLLWISPLFLQPTFYYPVIWTISSWNMTFSLQVQNLCKCCFLYIEHYQLLPLPLPSYPDLSRGPQFRSHFLHEAFFDHWSLGLLLLLYMLTTSNTTLKLFKSYSSV